MSITTTDFAAVTKAQKAAWETGDYPRVGNTLQIMAENLVEAVGVRPDQKVVDIAGGQGNAALSAARRFAEATSVDYAVNLLEQGRARAEAEHLPVRFVEGDAQDLPFAEAEFDVALSTVGSMFAPDHERTAAEIVRVVKPGGTVGLASWTPDSIVGDMFRCIGQFAPKPPPGVRPPVLWGSEEHLRTIFGDKVEWVSLEERTFHFCYRSAGHFAQWFIENYGPITRLNGTLDEDRRREFEAGLTAVAKKFDHGDGTTLDAHGTYLQAIGVRKP